jgi:pimeloyl-ACP methyl ester carboxylesterase
MAVSDELGERRTAIVPAGTLGYRERGEGPPLVFVHGALKRRGRDSNPRWRFPPILA